MGNPFAPRTWTHEITDPTDGEKWEVTLKTENAGEAIEIARASELSTSEAGFLRVQGSVVSWTLPMECTPDTIRALRDELFTQITRGVLSGPPTAEASSTEPTPMADTTPPAPADPVAAGAG